MIKLQKHIDNPNPNVYLSDNAWVVDVETTNLDKGDPCNPDNSLVLLVARHVGTRELLVSWGNEFEQSPVLERLNAADFIISHNSKFELGWLRRCGMPLRQNLSYCTIIGEYVYDGNITKERYLESLTRRYFVGAGKKTHVDALIKAGVCPSKIIPAWLEEYCVGDVDACLAIFLKQRALLKERGLLPVVYTRNLLTPVLADIEFNGMCLDKDRVEAVYRKYRVEHDEVTIELTKLTGSINLNSPMQLGNFIYDELKFKEPKNHYGKSIRTDTGRRTTNSKHLAKLVPKTAKQRTFLTLYKKQAKLDDALIKYLGKFKECCEKDNGLLAAKFNQCVTKTHRLSSTGGNKYKLQFQNMDRNFKPLFKARNKGWKVCEPDQAQLEYRVAVFLGDDALGKERISNDFDIHAHTAEIMTTAGQPTNRQEAKEHSFKPLFFGSSGTTAEQAYYKAFKDEHQGITETHDKWIKHVLKHKYLDLPTGLRVYWPDTKMTPTGYVTNSTQICNLPVQNLATAEIVPIGVVYLWHLTKANPGLKLFLVNTIHDSVIGEVPQDEVEEFKRLCEEAMVDKVVWYLQEVYGINFDVPLTLEHKASEFWNDSDQWRQTFLQ